MPTFPKPTKADLAAAYGQVVPDVIAPNLRILFCGINASLYSAVVGHHFARPGNRFWKTLHGAGFTDRLLHPSEDAELIHYGYGVTNIVDRATARADELKPDELMAGRDALARKIERYRPEWLAVLGISAYRVAFQAKKAVVGEQPTDLAGTRIWVLPNPSGLNAHYQLPDLQNVYGELKTALSGQL